MKSFVTICVVALGLIGVGLWKAKQHELRPEQVVLKYIELSAEADSEQIKQYTTNVPDVYWEYRLKAVREQRPSETQSPSEAVAESKRGSVVLLPKTVDNSGFWLSLVNEEYPKILRNFQRPVNKISQTWIKGNEAKVRVGEKTISGSLGGIELDFFLYQSEHGWKIFMIDLVNDSDKFARPVP
jgi:hypothetical protein